VALSERAQKLMAEHGGLPVVWQFRLDPQRRGDEEKWYTPAAPSEGWGKMAITSWWEEQLDRDYDGIGWYRVTADVPPVPPGTRLWLELGAVDESCWVYVNGEPAGAQTYDSRVDDDAWRKPRRFDITPHVRAGENVIVVKVQDLAGMGGIYRGAVLRFEPVSVLPRGMVDDGPQAWRLARQTDKGFRDLRAEDAAELGVELAADNGMYVGERSIRLTTRTDSPLRLSRDCIVPLEPGRYAFSARFKLQLSNPGSASAEPLAVRLRVGPAAAIEGEGGLAVELAPAATETGSEWQVATGALQVPEANTQAAARVEILVREAGIYHLDELTLQRVQ